MLFVRVRFRSFYLKWLCFREPTVTEKVDSIDDAFLNSSRQVILFIAYDRSYTEKMNQEVVTYYYKRLRGQTLGHEYRPQLREDRCALELASNVEISLEYAVSPYIFFLFSHFGYSVEPDGTPTP